METKPTRSPRLTPPVAAEVPEIAPAPAAEPAAAEPAAPMALLPPPPQPPAGGRDALGALMESQAAVARGLGEFSAEMAALTRGGIDAATQSAGDMLKAKTFADAVAINAAFARRSFDAWVGGSARLSEIGVKLAAEASRPILLQLNRDWAKAVR